MNTILQIVVRVKQDLSVEAEVQGMAAPALVRGALGQAEVDLLAKLAELQKGPRVEVAPAGMLLPR